LQPRRSSECKQFSPEDGSSMFLQNVGTCLQDYMVSQYRRPLSEKSPQRC
jgi:hypothetical protein